MKAEKCGECEGKGQVVIDHEAWISGGELKERDIWGSCLRCEGTGLEIEEQEEEE